MHTSHLSFHHETLHEESARIVSSQAVVEGCKGTGGGDGGNQGRCGLVSTAETAQSSRMRGRRYSTACQAAHQGDPLKIWLKECQAGKRRRSGRLYWAGAGVARE